MFKTKQKHSFHICVSFCWFFSEEGLTSCYKNIFIFVTIVELQDKSSVRNTAPAKARLQCHFKSTSPFSLCLFLSLSLSLAVAHQQVATNESKRACDTEGSVAGTFWVLCLNFHRKEMGTMANRVGGHSGMENTDAPSINKVGAITAFNSENGKGTSPPSQCALPLFKQC